MSSTGQNLLTRLPTLERRLANGLTVLVREDHSARVVAIVTHVKAGYFNEPDRLVGISHVLEHMYFKGTQRRGVGDIARETKDAGGYLNAGTIYDYTSYYTVLPSSSLAQGLDIQADALRNSQINEEELRKELRVIIQEANRKLDSPSAVAVERLYEEMFDVHRMRRWRIGTEEGLQRITRDDLWQYYRNLYRPSNIVLAVAGDLEPESTLELIQRYYGDMPAGEPVVEVSPPEPERLGLRFREIEGDIVQSCLEWGWRTPGSLHADTPALDLLATVLGQGRASRLYRQVREAGWVTSIGAYNYTPTDVGVFGIGAELLPADTDEALLAIWREVDALRRHGVRPDELARARNMLEARFVRRLETVEGQANMLAEWQALGDWRAAGDYLDKLLAASPDQLHEAAIRYLDLDAATVLLYRPAGGAGLGASADELGGHLRRAAADPARRTAADPVPLPASVPRPGPRSSTGMSPREEDGVYAYSLPNGLDLVVKPRRSSALVAMGICAIGGAVEEEAKQAGITSLMARVALKGTTTRSAAVLAEESEALGGALSPGVSPDLFSWSMSLPSRHFRHGFELLSDVVLNPTFPADELERERKVALSDLERMRDDMFRYPFRLFLQSAFAGHPYGFSATQTEAGVRGLSREDLAAWHERKVLRGRPSVFVVGDVDPDATAAIVLDRFGGLSGAPAPEGAVGPDWPLRARREVVQRAKSQTALVLGFPGPSRTDPDAYSMQVLSNIVSGLGGRLFEELRGHRSLAYTVTSYPVVRWRAGAFVTYIATSPEREEEARQGVLEELGRLREDLVEEEELQRAQRYTVGAWQIRSQTNGSQLGDLTGALLLGGGLRELREFEERTWAVSAERIRDAVRRFFDPERLVEGVVRGTQAEIPAQPEPALQPL